MSELTLAQGSVDLLRAVVDKTNKNDFLFTSENERAALISAELVEINSDLVDPVDPNRVATRATPKGNDFIMNQSEIQPQPPQPPQVQASDSGFEIETGIPMPKATRVTKTAKYPIDVLEIGQCFHIAPGSDDNGVPEDLDTLSKRVASVVSNANSRHRASKVPPEFKNVTRKSKDKTTGQVTESVVQVEDTIPLRRFTARRVDTQDPKGAGLRVFRVDIAS